MSDAQRAIDEYSRLLRIEGVAMWRVGDRVKLTLRYKSRRYAPKVEVTGTIDAVNPPGLPPGVRVLLDIPLNGVSDCYATHRELRSA